MSPDIELGGRCFRPAIQDPMVATISILASRIKPALTKWLPQLAYAHIVFVTTWGIERGSSSATNLSVPKYCAQYFVAL